MGEKIHCRYDNGTAKVFEVSEQDDRVVAHIVKLKKLLRKRIDCEYDEMRQDLGHNVYLQVTSGEFLKNAERFMDIFDDILHEMLIGMESDYFLKKDGGSEEE